MSHEPPSPLSPSHVRSIQVNYHSVQNRARLLRLRKTLVWPTRSERSNISPTETSVSGECFIAYLFMFHLQFLVSVYVFAFSNIYSICIWCLCVCAHSPASAADNVNPVYFSFPLSSVFQIYLTPLFFFSDFKADLHGGERGPCPGDPARAHTHTHTPRTKGVPPHI